MNPDFVEIEYEDGEKKSVGQQLGFILDKYVNGGTSVELRQMLGRMKEGFIDVRDVVGLFEERQSKKCRSGIKRVKEVNPKKKLSHHQR